MMFFCPSFTRLLLFIHIVQVLFEVSFTQTPSSDFALVTRPPNIYVQPDREVLYKIAEAVKLYCIATGVPTPKYFWKRQENLFDWSANFARYAQWPGQGTLLMNMPMVDDDGIYQCFAQNNFGISMSQKVNLRRADMQQFISLPTARQFTARKGTFLRIPCTGYPLSYPKGSLYWAKKTKGTDPIPLLYDSRVTQDQDANLWFTNVQDSDATTGDTEYVCVLVNDFMRATTIGNDAQLTVTADQEQFSSVTLVYNSPNFVTALVNGSTEFKCIFGSNPTAIVTWYDNNGISKFDAPRVSTADYGMTLRITRVIESDAKGYECRGTSPKQNTPVRVQFYLTVQSLPYWVVTPANQTVSVGGSAVFTCQAAGNPNPTIQWFINAIPIDQVKASPNRALDGNSLRFWNLNLNDSQVIQCNATNKYGYVFADFYLNVLNVKPAFVLPPQDLTRSEGQNVTVSCQVYSPPPVRISWKKGSQPISGGRYQILPTGDLYINSLLVTDTGVFECTATNLYGNTSRSAQLIVRRRTYISVPPTDARIYVNDQIKLKCTAFTDPLYSRNLSISWYKDDSLIDYQINPRVQLNFWDSSLIISAAMTLDTGRYTCNATNGIDTAIAYAQLVVQDAPNSPLNLQADCNRYKAQMIAYLTWDPGADNYAPLLMYYIEYNTSLAPDRWYPADLVNDSTTSSILSQSSRTAKVRVRPYLSYSFRITARNIVGLSDPSIPTSSLCKSDPNVPYTNPKYVIVLGTLPNNLVIYWTPLSEIEYNDLTVTYTLSVYCLNCQDLLIDPSIADVRSVTDPRWTSYSMTSFVKSSTEYIPIPTYRKFKACIMAKNSYGTSSADPSCAIGSSGETDATVAPQNLAIDSSSTTSGSAVALKWSAPNQLSDTVILGCFLGFRIEWWYQNEKNPTINFSWKDIYFTPGYTRVNPPCAQYASGPQSGRKKRSTDENLLSRKSRVAREIRKIRVRRATTGNNPGPTIYPGQPFTGTLSAVPGNASIVIDVRVITLGYAGIPSNQLTITTNSGLPGPPQDMTVILTATNFLVLNWTTPLQPNGALLGYQYAWQEVNGLKLSNMEVGQRIPNASMTRYLVNGLKPQQQYRMYLWAYTSSGSGEATYLDTSTAPAIPPGAPTLSISAVSSNSINVSFEPSTLGVSGSVFYAQYRKTGRSNWDQTKEETTRTVIYISGLSPGSYYQVRVVAMNGALLETPSETVEVFTDPYGQALLTVSAFVWLIILVLILLALIASLIVICFFKYKQVQKDKATTPQMYAFREDAHEPHIPEGDEDHVPDTAQMVGPNEGKEGEAEAAAAEGQTPGYVPGGSFGPTYIHDQFNAQGQGSLSGSRGILNEPQPPPPRPPVRPPPQIPVAPSLGELDHHEDMSEHDRLLPTPPPNLPPPPAIPQPPAKPAVLPPQPPPKPAVLPPQPPSKPVPIPPQVLADLQLPSELPPQVPAPPQKPVPRPPPAPAPIPFDPNANAQVEFAASSPAARPPLPPLPPLPAPPPAQLEATGGMHEDVIAPTATAQVHARLPPKPKMKPRPPPPQ